MSSNQWTCSVCTFDNDADRPTCEVCGTAYKKPKKSKKVGPRTLPIPTKSRPAAEWACTVCTFSNPSSASVCDMCGTEKPSISLQPSVPKESITKPSVPKGKKLNTSDKRKALDSERKRKEEEALRMEEDAERIQRADEAERKKQIEEARVKQQREEAERKKQDEERIKKKIEAEARQRAIAEEEEKRKEEARKREIKEKLKREAQEREKEIEERKQIMEQRKRIMEMELESKPHSKEQANFIESDDVPERETEEVSVSETLKILNTLSVQDQLKTVIENHLCTYSLTGNNYTNQHWFVCKTCSGKNEAKTGCCVTCKDFCHKDHNLVELRSSPCNFFCDCGLGTMPYSCKKLGNVQLVDETVIEEKQVEIKETIISETPEQIAYKIYKNPPMYTIPPDITSIFSFTSNVFKITFSSTPSLKASESLKKQLCRELTWLFKQAMKFKPNVVGISSLHSECDFIFASICLSLSIPFCGIITHKYSICQTFSSDSNLIAQGTEICEKADDVYVISDTPIETNDTHSQMRDPLVYNSDLLILVGHPGKDLLITDMFCCANNSKIPLVLINHIITTHNFKRKDKLNQFVSHRYSVYKTGSFLGFYNSSDISPLGSAMTGLFNAY